MDATGAALLAAGAAAAYLIGAVPFGFILGKAVCKTDVRKVGSGNIGATNLARVAGWRWGGFCLGLDFLKGFLPAVAGSWLGAGGSFLALFSIVWGLAAILGHVFPVYLKFKGGEGVATSLGVVTAISPIAAAAAVVVWVVTVAASRYVSLGSMLGSVAYAVTAVALTENRFGEGLLVTCFALLIPLVIIPTHHANVRRLLAGKENKIGARQKG